MRPLIWTVIQYDKCPYNRGKSEPTEISGCTCPEKRPRKGSEKVAICNPREKTQNRGFPYVPQSKPTLPTPGFWTPGLQFCEKMNFHYLKLLICGISSWQPKLTNTLQVSDRMQAPTCASPMALTTLCERSRNPEYG